ncbi:Tol-Pal system beta propeller repeat protein TolB [Thiomicrorhabdus arctica]|jgi:TolB protein|uniref:Tol-Pal system beta propeller repeat protein TolB n=1 Tax=Thiomicrorhabdus arctica TaxID=131540 RepID=UPI0003817E95|nr:Tol-Pal system beta propeller repeat protein TolB [Thiomicrorhabdus arctica]
MTIVNSKFVTFFQRIAKIRKLLLLSITAFSMSLFAVSAMAELTIEISEGYDNAIPIAIVPFHYEANNSVASTSSQTSNSQSPENLAYIIAADLRRSGRFRPLSNEELPAQPTDIDTINFEQWRDLDLDNLLMGKIIAEGNGFYQIEMRFIDVLRKNQVIGKRWNHIPKSNLRQIAHQMSDLIYEELTGVRGAFNTQISYVTLRKIEGKRHYTLEVADSDGFNPQPILKSNQPIMSPSWSPDGKKLAYVSFENGRSQIFIQSLDGKFRKNIAKFKGINGAPAWSPDGTKLAMTLSKGGSADIYVMELETGKLQQLTRKFSIETEAAWAANGESLYFNSDRRGKPQVFQVFLDTGEINRVTYNGNYNANPEISPDGRYLSVVHGEGGFHIGLLDLYTNEFRVLTDTFLDESPTFSPNGEMILYAMNQDGKGQLAVVAIDGKTSQTLKVKDGEVREPAWGPYLNP